MAFLNRIYEVLTRRKVQAVEKVALPDAMPPYAKPNAASILKVWGWGRWGVHGYLKEHLEHIQANIAGVV